MAQLMSTGPVRVFFPHDKSMHCREIMVLRYFRDNAGTWFTVDDVCVALADYWFINRKKPHMLQTILDNLTYRKHLVKKYQKLRHTKRPGLMYNTWTLRKE